MSTKPNKNFEFDVKDIELIEASLTRQMNYLQLNGDPETARYIYSLLGEIHNQKNWYRPKKVYVSG